MRSCIIYTLACLVGGMIFGCARTESSTWYGDVTFTNGRTAHFTFDSDNRSESVRILTDYLKPSFEQVGSTITLVFTNHFVLGGFPAVAVDTLPTYSTALTGDKDTPYALVMKDGSEDSGFGHCCDMGVIAEALVDRCQSTAKATKQAAMRTP